MPISLKTVKEELVFSYFHPGGNCGMMTSWAL
jgi:hypothetical protein